MQTQTYEMNNKGELTPVNTNAFKDLEPGTVLHWGGNMAWEPTRYCILSRRESSYGVMYACYNMDRTDQNAMLHQVESWSIKGPDDSVWHSQHMFLQPETVDAATVELYRQDHLRQAKAHNEREAQAKAEADRLEALGRELWPALIGECPAVIVAELKVDDSDSQTDYFSSHTTERVILAASKHTRDIFSEMRKAAELLPETQHLGVGKGYFSPYVEIGKDFRSNGSCHYQGSRSHWHHELDQDERGEIHTFATRAAAEDYIRQSGEPEPISFDGEVVPFSWNIEEREIEHREKYSMGEGYYLGHPYYRGGWKVSKDVLYNGGPRRDDYIDLAKRHDHLTAKGSAPAPKRENKPEPAKVDAPALTYDRDWTWLAFPCKPADEIRAAVKGLGFRWSVKREQWYAPRHVEAGELSAIGI